MIAYILMTCAWVIATITACFTFWKWRKCHWNWFLANVKIEQLQRRCVMLSLKCGEKDNTIRMLHAHLEFHRSTH